MRAPGLFSITRPANSLISGLTVILAYLIATGTVILPALVLAVIVLLVTAGGNVINDYYDAGIDRINRPERPIPSGRVRPAEARSFAVILFLSALLVSLSTPPLCLAIVILNTVILVAYAARLKGLPVAGNAAVAYLAASIFLFGGAFAGWDALARVLPLAGITFLATFSRELLKDAEDVTGDAAGGADTLPIRAGIPPTTRVALVFSILAAGASLVPAFWWGPWYLAGILGVDLLITGAVLRTLPCTTPACVKASRATTLVKGGMYAALAVFAVSALFL